MHRSHTQVVDREVSVCDLTAGPKLPKVVRIVTRLNIGGPALHTLLLTRELTARNYQTVLVAGACEPGDGDMQHPLQAADDVHCVTALSRSVHPWRNLTALWQLHRLIRREQPDIVHTHTAMAGCLGRLAAILCGTPVVVHTFHGNSLNEYFSRPAAAVFRRIEQFLARFTDAICVVSAQQAGELSARHRIAPREKFRVVELGLDLDDYFALRPPSASGPLTVGWFGRMVPVKNLGLLAATIESALEQQPDMRFIIAGDGPDRSQLNQVTQRYGDRVECLGWQREILPAMARCDVLLQTSRNEGTPVALIQGMAAARPFVSTAVGGLVDMVAGKPAFAANGACWYSNGVLADAAPESLAGALAMFARDRTLIVRMGCEGRAMAGLRYSKQRLVRDMDSLYSELLLRRTQ